MELTFMTTLDMKSSRFVTDWAIRPHRSSTHVVHGDHDGDGLPDGCFFFIHLPPIRAQPEIKPIIPTGLG